SGGRRRRRRRDADAGRSRDYRRRRRCVGVAPAAPRGHHRALRHAHLLLVGVLTVLRAPLPYHQKRVLRGRSRRCRGGGRRGSRVSVQRRVRSGRRRLRRHGRAS
ncbi:unnamed protein product, partial [Ectocarpus sp. 8 AP-2014]